MRPQLVEHPGRVDRAARIALHGVIGCDDFGAEPALDRSIPTSIIPGPGTNVLYAIDRLNQPPSGMNFLKTTTLTDVVGSIA